MDLSKPPTRLKVVLLSLPPRTQAVLDYFFSSTGRSSFSPTSAETADAAIFDLDTLESRHHWDAFHGQTGRPGIAMSIQPQQVPGAVWVRKPITPAALLHAAAELHAGRWTRVEPPADQPPVAAAVPAAPAVSAVSAAPVSSVALAPAPVAVAPLDVPVPAVIAAVAAAPAVQAPRVSMPVADVAQPPVPAPARTVPAEPPASPPAAVPAPVPPIARPAAVQPPASPVVRPPVKPPVAAQPAANAAAARAPAPAPAAGLTGLFKRLIGAALGKVEAPAPVAAPVASAASTATRPDAGASAAVVEPSSGSGWHEVSADDASSSTPGQNPAQRSPAQPGAHKGLAAGSKSGRKKGRKGSTRWVDPSAPAAAHSATSEHADPDADDDQDDDVVAEPTPSESAEIAGVEPATPPAADVPEGLAPESVPVDEPDAASDAAEPNDAAVDAAADASLDAAPQRPSGWGERAADHDPVDEALLCGSRGDWSEPLLASDASLRYDPALTVVGAMTEAYLVGGKWRVPTHFDCSAGRITVDTSRNRVHMNFDVQLLPTLWASTLDKRLKTNTLNRQEHADLMERVGETSAWQPLDRVLWRAGMETACGRLPIGVDLRTPIYLKHWPNLTRVQRTPHALRIAALWAVRGASLLETTELLHISQRHVFAFYNAALAMDLITVDGSQIRRSQRKSQRNRGLITRLLGWLHK